MTNQPDLFEHPFVPSPILAGGRHAPAPDIDRAPTNLADALAYFEGPAGDLPKSAVTRSAFRAVGRVLGKPLEAIPTDAVQLRALLRNAMPASAGMKPATWKQSKSRALTGLRELGIELAAGRDATPLHPSWAALSAELENRRLQIGLSKLLRFLSRHEITPHMVTGESLKAFHNELEQHSLHSNPASAHRQVLRCWEQAARAVPGWPQITLSKLPDERRYALDWDSFPPSFAAEVQSFLTSRKNADPLTGIDTKKVRSATTDNREQMLRRFASALVHSKAVAREDITGLSVLVEIQNVRAALSFMRDRHADKKLTEGHINHAWLLRTVARFWLMDEPTASRLEKFISLVSENQRSGPRGMRPKNRARLRQFELPQNIDRLVFLPQRIFGVLGKTRNPSYRDAVRAMYALQVGILTFVPVRSKNLVELKLGENLIDLGKGANRKVRIRLSPDETKTRRDYDAPLPSHLYPLLDAWLTVYRPRITERRNPYLFPNPSGEVRSRDCWAGKMTRFLKVETGLVIHPHLFRHIAAKLYLDHDPSGIEVVRQALGHTSTRTTLRVYAEVQTDPAFQRLEAAILKVRAPVRRSSKRKSELGE